MRIAMMRDCIRREDWLEGPLSCDNGVYLSRRKMAVRRAEVGSVHNLPDGRGNGTSRERLDRHGW